MELDEALRTVRERHAPQRMEMAGEALADEVESLRAQLELEAADALAAEQNWADRLVAARAEVESLRAAVARVREIHWRTVDETSAVDYISCNECCDGEYPCPTIRALDGADPA